MLYLLENTMGLGEDFLDGGMRFLSLQRREKIGAYGSLHDKADGCGAYLLLRVALYREYGIREQPLFTFGEHDKPFLKNDTHIHFNISHCKTALGCIVSDRNTSLDLTDRRKLKNNVMKRVCSDEEQRIILQDSDPDTCFLKYWTRKECFSKLTGEGMSRAFSGITSALPEMAHIHTKAYPDYILSYYAENEQPPIIFQPDELMKECETLFADHEV